LCEVSTSCDKLRELDRDNISNMLGGYEAQTEYYPQWHQPYNYVTQLPYGECIHILIDKIDYS